MRGLACICVVGGAPEGEADVGGQLVIQCGEFGAQCRQTCRLGKQQQACGNVLEGEEKLRLHLAVVGAKQAATCLGVVQAEDRLGLGG